MSEFATSKAVHFFRVVRGEVRADCMIARVGQCTIDKNLSRLARTGVVKLKATFSGFCAGRKVPHSFTKNTQLVTCPHCVRTYNYRELFTRRPKR